MDKLKQCALEYKKLFNRDFHITLENNTTLKTYFAKKHFHHLIGLHKLEDVRKVTLSKTNTATNVYNYILKGYIKYNDISSSKHFDLMKDRVDNFNSINSMLFEKIIVNFDSSKVPSTKLNSNIILFQDKGNYYLHLCLAQDNLNLKNPMIYYPETFLVRDDDYYIKNQKILKVKELKIIDSKKQNVLYVYNPNQIQEEVAATIINSKQQRRINMAEDKTKEILEKLENGIKETMDSEKYKAFLKVQSQFHNYSFNNAMLIYLQRPDATRVAGYQAWKKNFKRQVMKGEKGIGILAPSPYKYDKWIDKLDPKTKAPIKDPATGEVKKEKITLEGIKFKKVSVFDVKQTEGKELPSLCNELQGNSSNAENIIKAIKQVSEVPVIEKNIDNGAKGYYSRLENVIAVQEGMSLDQTAKTLIHEYAHSQLHNTESAKLLDRATKEVEAESVAYVVSDRFGVDTSQYSFEYLASWSSGKDLKELKDSFSLIQKTANKMIEKIENVLTKELELQQTPVRLEIVWSESSILKEGQVLGFKEANDLFTKHESELFKTRNESKEYVSYEKTKFKVHLIDGRSFEGRFDFGDGIYKDLAECIKKECYIDVNKYIKEHKAKQLGPVENEKNINVLDKIKDLYKKEFTAIKYISEKTANIIDNLNKQNGENLTIKEIKQTYKELGKRLEQSNNKSDMEEFKVVKDVIDDLKQSQLKMKKELAHENAQEQTMKTQAIEMVD
ncbi:MAG: PBECR4 domain-containing protein [Peptostreptococcaceae bacterium]|jgi:hypothetical protein|nr:PBECR4 domain-containing protein [Peptostreptococcaceae bacterium]